MNKRTDIHPQRRSGTTLPPPSAGLRPHTCVDTVAISSTIILPRHTCELKMEFSKASHRDHFAEDEPQNLQRAPAKSSLPSTSRSSVVPTASEMAMTIATTIAGRGSEPGDPRAARDASCPSVRTPSSTYPPDVQTARYECVVGQKAITLTCGSGQRNTSNCHGRGLEQRSYALGWSGHVIITVVPDRLLESKDKEPMKSLSLAKRGIKTALMRGQIFIPQRPQEPAPAPRQPAQPAQRVSDVQLSSERRAAQQAQNQQSGASGTRTGPAPQRPVPEMKQAAPEMRNDYSNYRAGRGSEPGDPAQRQAASARQGAQQPTAPVVNNGPRVGRNDPVPVARARNTRTATAADCNR